MEDQELAAIRAARMNQLQQSPSSGPESAQDAAEEESRRAAQDQMRRDLLATVLDSNARERLSRIALVSEGRARQIETLLLRMAQQGSLRGRVSEAQLIELLEQIDGAQNKSAPSKGAIKFQRRKGGFDDDDDF